MIYQAGKSDAHLLAELSVQLWPHHSVEEMEREYRHNGLAGELLAACEDWAKQMGCSEFASDCELSNEASRKFHLKNGFEEANRIICFAKQL